MGGTTRKVRTRKTSAHSLGEGTGREDDSDGVATGTGATQMIVIRTVRETREGASGQDMERNRAKFGTAQDMDNREPARGSWENRARHYQLERGLGGKRPPRLVWQWGWGGDGGYDSDCEEENRTGQDTKRKRASERHSPAGEGGGLVPGCCDWDGFFGCAGSNGVARDRKIFHSLK